MAATSSSCPEMPRASVSFFSSSMRVCSIQLSYERHVEALRDLGNKSRCPVDVNLVGGLDGGVHVAQRNAQDAGGDTGADQLQRVRIRAGIGHAGFFAGGDLDCLGSSANEFEDVVIDDRADSNARTAAEWDGLVFRNAVGVGMRDVDGDTDVGVSEIAAGPGAVPSDFFLNGEGHDDIIWQCRILEQFESLYQSHTTEAVVLSLSREPLVHEMADAGRERDGGTNVDQLEDLLTWKSDIDPELIGGNRLVHFVLRHDVDRLESDDPGQRFCAMDDDLQPRPDAWVDRSAMDAEKTLVVDPCTQAPTSSRCAAKRMECSLERPLRMAMRLPRGVS